MATQYHTRSSEISHKTSNARLSRSLLWAFLLLLVGAVGCGVPGSLEHQAKAQNFGWEPELPTNPCLGVVCGGGEVCNGGQCIPRPLEPKELCVRSRDQQHAGTSKDIRVSYYHATENKYWTCTITGGIDRDERRCCTAEDRRYVNMSSGWASDYKNKIVIVNIYSDAFKVRSARVRNPGGSWDSRTCPSSDRCRVDVDVCNSLALTKNNRGTRYNCLQ